MKKTGRGGNSRNSSSNGLRSEVIIGPEFLEAAAADVKQNVFGCLSRSNRFFGNKMVCSMCVCKRERERGVHFCVGER